MHRTSPWAWSLLGGLLALLAGGLSPEATAQTCSPEPRQVLVLVNSTVRLQMLSKKRIRAATNPKEGVLEIRPIEADPTSVLILGRTAGVTRLELEDTDGCKEYREVVVQADVEFLICQLRRAVPQAQINVIPVGTNQVVLTGYVQRAEDISVAAAIAQSNGFAVINGLRMNGVQQVQLDVVIAQVRRTKGRNFGFNFLQNSRRQIFGSTIGNLIGGAPTQAVGVTSSVLQPTDFGQVINSIPNQANLFGGVIGNNSGFLGFLQALQNEGLAKILSQPRLVVLSGQTASLLAGGEQAVPVPAGLGQVGVQFEEFGTRLNVLPVVLGNGRIHVEIEPEVSTLDATAGVAIAGATVAGRATQRVHTTVELESGQTFVIGGLIQKVTNATANKVPLLGQVPFVGALFSTKVHVDDETELVVLVTPHLVDAQTADQLVKVLPGQETRTPDDFELFLEGILEAPRGPRAVFVNGRYVPAHRNGPTAELFPCSPFTDGVHAVCPGGVGNGGRGAVGPGGPVGPGGVGCGGPGFVQGGYPAAVPVPGPLVANAPHGGALPVNNAPVANVPVNNAPAANVPVNNTPTILPPILRQTNVVLPDVSEQPEAVPAHATLPDIGPASGTPPDGEEKSEPPVVQTAAPEVPQQPANPAGEDQP